MGKIIKLHPKKDAEENGQNPLGTSENIVTFVKSGSEESKKFLKSVREISEMFSYPENKPNE